MGAGRRQPAAPRHPGQRHHDRVRVDRARAGRPGASRRPPRARARPRRRRARRRWPRSPTSARWSPPAERERQARLVRWLRAELDRRRAPARLARLARPARGSWSCSTAWPPSAPSGRTACTASWEDLQRVFADGPEVGVHTVVTADRSGAVPGCDAVAGPAAVAVPDGRCPRAVRRSGCGPATCPISDPGGRIVAERSPGGAGGPARGRARRRGRPPGRHGRRPEPARRPVAIGVLPAEVDPADLVGAVQIGGDPWTIPVGVGRCDAGARGAGAARGRARAGGRSGALGSDLAADRDRMAGPGGRARRPPSSPWPAAARPLAPRRAPSTGCSAPTRARGPLDAACGRAGPVLVLVDDADLIDDDDGALSRPAGRSGGPICTSWPPAATRRSGPGYSHWTRALRASRAAVLLQPDLDLDGDLAGTTLPAPLDRGPHAGPRLPRLRRRARRRADHGFT